MRHSLEAKQESSESRSRTLQDRLIDTSNFDNISKRSVERLHHPKEAQYQRHFVKKPQRRSPLLNRLYWIRLKAVEHLVLSFLRKCTGDEPKVVVNLGCGYDTLAWRLNHGDSTACQGTRFIDVDLAPLMIKKKNIVTATPQLCELLDPDHQRSMAESDHPFLTSTKYCQVACDFTDSAALKDVLPPMIPAGSKVLVLAEMSLMYQDDVSADALLQWAHELEAEFCLLEHCLPGGPHHPLAAKLLQDHEKAQTPLISLRAYETEEAHRARFRDMGWAHVKSWNLWDVWAGDHFIDPVDREVLDSVEPLDDWEDLILLCRHFFILHASDEAYTTAFAPLKKQTTLKGQLAVTLLNLPKVPKRRLGAALSPRTPEGSDFLVNIMGFGTNGPSDTYDVFGLSHGESMVKLPSSGPPTRAWFTLTDLGEIGTLLVGGKSQSSSDPLLDCWIFTRGTRPRWTKTWDLPRGLYQHSTVRLGQTSMLLALGGRHTQGLSADIFVFHPDKGWQTCEIQSSAYQPVFRAAAWCISEPRKCLTPTVHNGIICGGLSASGTPSLTAHRWSVDLTTPRPTIKFETVSLSTLALVGPSVVTTGSEVFLCGGVGSRPDSECLGQSIVRMRLKAEAPESSSLFLPARSECSRWPLMLGSSVVAQSEHMLLAGGGATAFPSGALWNNAIHSISLHTWSESQDQDELQVKLLEVPKITNIASGPDLDHRVVGGAPQMLAIPRMQLGSAEDFRAVLDRRQPVIIEGLDFGVCLTDWTPEYLADRVGPETEVVVHESVNDSPRLDFNAKNFKYVTEPFGKVISKMERGARMYLRSLSRSKPSDIPANIKDDFPDLAPDFRLPSELHHAKESLFSSILRLSGRANMWLHYDVMANIYTQIRGKKQMILFPPRDATKLAFAPGASSSSFDVFSTLGTDELAGTQPHEAMLGEGDALFLPAAWLHTATPLTDMSIAVNVFFRDLNSGYADGRDVYGNRDLAAYEKGRQEAAKIARGFRQVPQDIRQFYLSRIADELLQLAENP